MKSEKRLVEFRLGRYLLDFVLVHEFKIDDYKIEYKNNKPFLKNGDICFNISHSGDIVLLCTEKNPVGVDIEYIKKRDFSKFEKRYEQKFNLEFEFYEFWTQLEAKIKLQEKCIDCKTFRFRNDYCISAASSDFIKEIEIFELKAPFNMVLSEIIR